MTIPVDTSAAIVFPPTLMGNTNVGEGFWTVAHNPRAVALDGVTPQSYVAWIRKRKGGVFTRLIGVGRTRNNDVVLPFEDISKYHAYFEARSVDELISVADAGSKNGTFVNGTRLESKRPHPLCSGDAVAFGNHGGVIFDTAKLAKILSTMTHQERDRDAL